MTLTGIRMGVLYAALGLHVFGEQHRKPVHRRPVHKVEVPPSTETIRAVSNFMQPNDPRTCLEEASQSPGAPNVGFHRLYDGQISCTISPSKVTMSLFNQDRSAHVMLQYQRNPEKIDVTTEQPNNVTAGQTKNQPGHYFGDVDHIASPDILLPIVRIMQTARMQP